MMHKVELYLNEDEYEKITVLQRYHAARSKEILHGCDCSPYPLDIILKLGVFDSIFDLSCLKDLEKIAEMKEYLSRMEEK